MAGFSMHYESSDGKVKRGDCGGLCGGCRVNGHIIVAVDNL